MTTTFNVSNVSKVDVSFWVDTGRFDSGEKIYGETSTDGDRWSICYAGSPTSYTQGWCNVDVANKNTLYLRFRTNANNRNEYGYVDDVLVTGAGSGDITVDCDHIWQRSGSGFYEDNPTYVDQVDHTAEWSFSTPEAQGMDAAILDDGLDSLESERTLLSVTIVRNSHIVRERFYHGSSVNHANNIHSASKSMLLAMLAYAVEQGHIASLDDAIADYFPEYDFPGEKANITIQHLMNMSSGWEWQEDMTEYDIEAADDWVQAIIALDTVHQPGTVFNYSTGNTHVLSGLIANATGQSTCEYAHENLFEPLGIIAEHWGRDPQGVYSGGYNLYMTPREMAKYAQFILDILNDGDPKPTGFNKIIKDSIAEQFVVDQHYSYGELWWLRTLTGYDMNFGWGYGGQFMYIMPSLNIVMITTQDTSVFDGEINSGAFIKNYLIPSTK